MEHVQASDVTASSNAKPSAEPSAVVTPLVDHERVLEMIDLICEGEPAAFGSWVGYLEADLAKFAALMSDAGSTDRNLNILNTAHALKGTCLNLGAPALGALFAELEKHAKEGQWDALLLRYQESRALEIQSTNSLREVALPA